MVYVRQSMVVFMVLLSGMYCCGADRARQVDLQMSPGAAAFARAEVVRELGLTVEQQTEVRGITRVTAREYNEVMAKMRSERVPAFRDKLVEQANQIRTRAKQQVVDEVLNDEQNKKWKQMLGEPATEAEKRSYQQRSRGERSRPSRSSSQPPRIPVLTQVRRVSVDEKPTAEERAMALWIQKTREHPVAKDGYVVLTDHTDAEYLNALRELSLYRKGQVIEVNDLGHLYQEKDAFQAVSKNLQQISPRFVAVAPRLESLSENTLVCLWDLLSGLDGDPQIDVFPGILVAATKEGFVRLIQNSINAKPNGNPLKAFGICQASGREGFRSFQKIELLEREWAGRGGSMSSAVIGHAEDLEVTRTTLPVAGDRWEVSKEAGLVRDLPQPAEEAMEEASLLLLFGHGVPGMVCGIDITAFDDIDLTGKVVLSACCFAGMGNRTDIVQPKRGPDGSVIQSDRPKFVLTAVDRGAVVAYGHMRLSNGFPSLAPLLEGLLAGKSSGEVYQQLLNALIEYHRFESVYAGENAEDAANLARRINPFLVVLVGDPALVAYQAEQRTE